MAVLGYEIEWLTVVGEVEGRLFPSSIFFQFDLDFNFQLVSYDSERLSLNSRSMIYLQVIQAESCF